MLQPSLLGGPRRVWIFDGLGVLDVLDVLDVLGQVRSQSPRAALVVGVPMVWVLVVGVPMVWVLMTALGRRFGVGLVVPVHRDDPGGSEAVAVLKAVPLVVPEPHGTAGVAAVLTVLAAVVGAGAPVLPRHGGFPEPGQGFTGQTSLVGRSPVGAGAFVHRGVPRRVDAVWTVRGR